MMELVHLPLLMPLLMAVLLVQCSYRRILQKHFLPLVAERQRRGKATILQDDNAPVHRASVVNNHCLESLAWPVQSPDLNPIKNFWMVLKKAIRRDALHQNLFLTCRL